MTTRTASERYCRITLAVLASSVITFLTVVAVIQARGIT